MRGGIVSGIEALLAFLTGLVLFTYGSRRLDDRIGLGLLLASGTALYWIGPNPFLFGMFLACGWYMLSLTVDRAFSAE